MSVVAFLVYHTRTGRTRFVDQIHVSPTHRRMGHATRLLLRLATGPMELVVRRDNADAIATYVKYGFCQRSTTPSGYEVDAQRELFLRTTSWMQTKAMLLAASASAAPPHRVEEFAAWDAVPAPVQAHMVHAVRTTEGLTQRQAREVVAPSTGPAPRYVVVLAASSPTP